MDLIDDKFANEFTRSKYNSGDIDVKHIYPKGWFMYVFVIELFFAILAGPLQSVRKLCGCNNSYGIVLCCCNRGTCI